MTVEFRDTLSWNLQIVFGTSTKHSIADLRAHTDIRISF